MERFPVNINHEYKWYNIPYIAIGICKHACVILLCYMLANYFYLYDDNSIQKKYDVGTLIKMKPDVDPLKLQLFNVTSTSLRKTRWVCDTLHMKKGRPTFTVKTASQPLSVESATLFSNYSNASELSTSNIKPLLSLQTCMTKWLANNSNRCICMSSYNFGSSTKVLSSKQLPVCKFYGIIQSSPT